MSERPWFLEPLVFPNGRTAPNRVWLAAMTNRQSHDDGHLSDDELHWLASRAAGGFGVLASCATHVLPAGKGFEGQWGCFSDAHTEDWRRAAAEVHAGGALLLAQLYHGGRRALRTGDHPVPLSASALEEADGPVREATEAEVEEIVAAFAAAARRVADAGGDGVELHGAHGYLLAQFQGAVTNQRQDKWGGDLDGRSRLLFEVFKAVRAATPPWFIVGVRLSPEDRGGPPLGIQLEETVELAGRLAEAGADFVHISLWDIHLGTVNAPEVHPLPLFRARMPAHVPLVTAGAVWTADDAAFARDQGADVVALGRSAIVNPEWPRLAGQEGWTPVRPPVTSAYLEKVGLGTAFVDYMGRWPGFVDDTPGNSGAAS